MEKLALTVADVTGAESWGQANASLLSADGSESETVSIYAPPAKSTLIQPVLEAGRWLLPGDTNTLVIGPSLLAKRPDLGVGDKVTLPFGEVETTWTIVGIYRMSGNVNPPLLYANYESLDRYMPEQGLTTMLQVSTVDGSVTTQRRAAQALEKAFGGQGLQTAMVQVNEDWLAQQRSSFNVIIYFLLVMAALIALVGVLGLTGMMSMNVLERTREIGVLRAVGASNGAVLGMVIAEGTTVGLVSWLLALALSFPLTSIMDSAIGTVMFKRPFPYVIGWQGWVIWLAGVLVLSALASALPAGRAVRLTVRDVLAYE